jgi:hypothetical protein
MRPGNRRDAVRSVAVTLICDSFFTWYPSGGLGVNEKRDREEMRRMWPGSGDWVSSACTGGKVVGAAMGSAPARVPGVAVFAFAGNDFMPRANKKDWPAELWIWTKGNTGVPYKDMYRGAVQKMVAAARAAGAVPVALLAANYTAFAHIFTRHTPGDAQKSWMFDGGEWSVQTNWNTMFNDARQIWLEEGALTIDASGLYAHGELRAPGGDGWHFSTPAARELAIGALDEAVRLGLAWAEPGRGWGLVVPDRPELLQVAVPEEDPWSGLPEQARRVPGAGASLEAEVSFEDLPPEVQEALRARRFDDPWLQGPGLAEHVRRARNAQKEDEAREGPQRPPEVPYEVRPRPSPGDCTLRI